MRVLIDVLAAIGALVVLFVVLIAAASHSHYRQIRKEANRGKQYGY